MADKTKIQPTAKSNDAPAEDSKKLENGPIEKRSCTDIPCCLLFIAAMGLMIYLTIQGYTKGDVWKLLAPWDVDSNACGVKNSAMEKFKYIYFTIPCPTIAVLKAHNICVDHCPITFDSKAFDASGVDLTCKTNTAAACPAVVKSYTSQATFTTYCNTGTYGTDFFYYPSKPYFGRLCFPQSAALLDYVKGSLGTLMSNQQISEWIADIQAAWALILISVGFTFILGLIYMLFVRIFSGIIVWLCILAYFLGLAALAVFLYGKGQMSGDVSSSDSTLSMSSNPKQSTSDNRKSYQVLFWIVVGVFAISLVIFCCLYKNIKLAIAIIKTATIYVVDVPLVMFVPILFTIVTAGWWAFWICTMLCVYSNGYMYHSTSGPWASIDHKFDKTKTYVPALDPTKTYQDLTWHNWYFLFGGLWVNAFISAVCQFTLASTACLWYFNKQSGLHSPISRSIGRAFRYHLGSIAFGSLILALVQIVRIILEYVNKQMKASGAKTNKLMVILMNCLRCYMACFERFIRFLNRQAYIQIALSGRNFCSAAKEAIRVLWANAARVSIINGLGAVFIFLGKLFMVICTVLACYLVLTRYEYYKDNVSNPILPCIIIGIIAYVIAVVFMSVYGLAIDSILMCFLYDEEMAKGKGNQKPKHCPPSLEDFFKNNAVKE